MLGGDRPLGRVGARQGSAVEERHTVGAEEHLAP